VSDRDEPLRAGPARPGGAVEALHFTWLSIAPVHALAVARLPPVHRDPFDRLLVAQAMSGFTLVTADERLTAYPVTTWSA